MPKLSELIEMRHDLFSAVEADLETGSHHRNNLASQEFNAHHPRLVQWMEKFADLVDKEVEEVSKHL